MIRLNERFSMASPRSVDKESGRVTKLCVARLGVAFVRAEFTGRGCDVDFVPEAADELDCSRLLLTSKVPGFLDT